MTLTLVTLTITGSLTLTQFSRSSTATATAPLFCSRPSLRFPSGVGWVLNLPCPSPSACDNLLCPLTPFAPMVGCHVLRAASFRNADAGSETEPEVDTRQW